MSLLDPIGGLGRIREFMLSYLDTAFRIRDDQVARARRELLRSPGSLTNEVFLEPVPRYQQVVGRLEDLVDEARSNPLSHFSRDARRAFVELALSGLFPGRDSGDSDIRRRSVFSPYLHQWTMLERGTRAGTPGIVTSGTGSGKTESFMLPVLATIAAEAVRWPAPHGPLSGTDWFVSDQGAFQLQRGSEAAGRPKAVRAIVLYPMNALVEDQLTRLRRSLDSEEARSVMDERFGGNRVYFGRYTSETPVTGHLEHPRRADTEAERRKLQRRMEALRQQLRRMQDGQSLARQHDERERERAREAGTPEPDETRYLFPSLDGGELVTRWDMQRTPPDILVTNTSMLSTMLVREVEASIFESTRAWLESSDDSYFFLVLDELHLIRGSSGMEVVGLLRNLFARLGLDRPEHRHKLRILASSASLPLEGELAQSSLQYLHDFFGSFGTRSGPDAMGYQRAEDWAGAIVTGRPIRETLQVALPLPRAPFARIAELLTPNEEGFASQLSKRSEAIDSALRDAAVALRVNSQRPLPEMVASAVASASSVLVASCSEDETAPRATSVATLAQRVFGSADEEAREALRGLCIVRGLGDVCGRPEMYGRAAPEGLAGIRVHGFLRSIEGLFASPLRDAQGELRFDGVTVERGRSHATCRDEVMRRLFELVYCEACGELFVGGQRNADTDLGATELLASAPNLEQLPEAAATTNYENLSHSQYAIFWPRQAEAKDGDSAHETWASAVLDTRNGVVFAAQRSDATHLPGRLFQFDPNVAGPSPHSPGSASPRCCPACGTDYSLRRQGMGSLSPLRSFRTGFAKTSQLLATELFSLLHASATAAKSVVFSDSRQDAARAALDIERRHHQDTRRQLVVEALRQVATSRPTPQELEEMRGQRAAAAARGDWELAGRLNSEIQRVERQGDPTRVPLAEVIEPALSTETRQLRALLRRHAELGMHPTDAAGIKLVGPPGGTRPWYEWVVARGASGSPEWPQDSEQGAGPAAEARAFIRGEQQPLTYEVLFSKTYFALEETGLGYPSMVATQTGEADRLDAYLRVFADAYRVIGNRWSVNVAHVDSAREFSARNRIYRFARASVGGDPMAELDNVLGAFRNLGHEHGLVELSRLQVRLRQANDPFYRCTNCGRVHLHLGTRRCTRCFVPLPDAQSGEVGDLWRTNFLARRILRAEDDGTRGFRLRCEELTGQTGSPAERLRAFKGIFVSTDNSPAEQLRRRASEVDLLSVTTTMEVGIDIGALQSVYQANMPPQRFNYQQRVGRAGRRGQAFSMVVTLCRSRSHDLHYWRNPAAITGDPPPPPFLTTGHMDIQLRVVRKAWLTAAFAILRDEDGPSYPGDDVVDTHGEFPSTAVVFADGSPWRQRLAVALDTAIGVRDATIDAIYDGRPAAAATMRSTLLPNLLVDGIWARADEGLASGLPLAQFLAEQGLLPMYGMPTRVRPLYLEVERVDNELMLGTVDRDLDLAVYEFAPGRSLIRDKQKHESIGFSPALREPPGTSTRALAFGQWRAERRFVARCVQCSATTTRADTPTEPVTCVDCGQAIESDTFLPFVSPAAFTTDFEAKEVEEGETMPTYRRIVAIEAASVDVLPVPNSNMAIRAVGDARVLRLNEGELDDTGAAQPFTVIPALEQRVPSGRGRYWTLPGQRIAQDQFARLAGAGRARRDPAFVDESIGLMARKRTDAIYLAPLRVPEGLDISRVGRSPRDTAVRAALVSATHLLIQRAALELDIAPEEFEALEPRLRDGRPLIQLADFLVNGAGFSNRLAQGEPPLVARLVDSMVRGAESDELVGRFFDERHRNSCSQACYECLQRYGNRGYHGLLDWRLGLGMLRIFADASWSAGLDGRWEDAPEISDWPALAERLAIDITALTPDKYEVISVGRLHLPSVRTRRGAQQRFVFVHPFWSAGASSAACDDGYGGETFFVDTFQASRRPQRAFQVAREIAGAI